MDFRKVIALGGSVAVALLLAAAGLHYDARILFYAGIILLSVVIAAWLFFWAHPITTPPVDSADTERRSRRRKILNEARALTAQHELQTRWDWRQTTRYSPAFADVRPHLSKAYMDRLAAVRTIAVGQPGLPEPLVQGFLNELDRLEREWKLS